MSNFIDKSDYSRLIRSNRLDEILDADDALLDEAEKDAIAEVSDYLAEYYDVDQIFSQSGSSRNRNALNWTRRVVMYMIYERVPDQLVPERIIKNYDDTIRTLEKIAAGKINAELPRKMDEESKARTKFRWGSQNARSH